MYASAKECTFPQKPFLCESFVDGFAEVMHQWNCLILCGADQIAQQPLKTSVLKQKAGQSFPEAFSSFFPGIRDRMVFDLYLWMFPTFLEHMSVAFVDLAPLYQSHFPVMELQAST